MTSVTYCNKVAMGIGVDESFCDNPSLLVAGFQESLKELGTELGVTQKQL